METTPFHSSFKTKAYSIECSISLYSSESILFPNGAVQATMVNIDMPLQLVKRQGDQIEALTEELPEE